MLGIEINKIKLTVSHIEFIVIIEMANIELIGGHIEFMLIIETAK